MVNIGKIVNTEIEIYRIEIFFLISKSVFTESVFEICNFDFDFKSIILKFFHSVQFDINFHRLYFEIIMINRDTKMKPIFSYKSIWNRFLHYKSIWNRFLHYKSIWKWDYGTLIHQQCPKEIDLKPIQNRNKLDFYL